MAVKKRIGRGTRRRSAVQNGDGDTAARARTTGTRASVSAGAVERAIAAALNGGETLSVGVLNLVRNTLVTALAGARDVGGEIGVSAVSAVRGAIRAAEAIGADLGAVAKHAIQGTIEAAEAIGGELGGVARSATRGAVKATADVGGDVALVSRRAVEGTAEAARTLGADVAAIARSAAQGAVEAADRIGGATSRSVRATLSGTVAGVRALLQPGSNGRRPAMRASGRRAAPRRRSRVVNG